MVGRSSPILWSIDLSSTTIHHETAPTAARVRSRERTGTGGKTMAEDESEETIIMMIASSAIAAEARDEIAEVVTMDATNPGAEIELAVHDETGVETDTEGMIGIVGVEMACS
jgi:hypothetical protein